MKDFFKPEDFDMQEGGWLDREAADRANAKLNAYIQCLEKVYGDSRLGSYHGKPLLWSIDEKADSTHSVRLIDLEKIQRPGS